MRILKNDSAFKVLSKPDQIIENIAEAARTCYDSFDNQTPDNDIKLVKNLINRGHYAMLEFGHLTVKFSGTSRGLSHEQVRHRLASYGQRSTRYVDESDMHVIVPPHKDENIIINDEANNWSGSLVDFFSMVENAYGQLKKSGWKNDEARQVLPIALEAPIVVCANMTEWRHIFKMRTSEFAHWEINHIMLELLKWCKSYIPIIFDDFHIFEKENGGEYAKNIVSDYMIKDIIKHKILSDTSNKKKLIDFINKL